MSFNVSKCSILRIHGSKSPVEYQYRLLGQPLEIVQHHKYLGVDLDSKLNWNNHVSNIVGKANRSLGFVKRNLNKCPEEVKKQAYYTLVRPNLEYGSSAWDPHTKKQINAIEGVQCRAARFVKQCHERTPGMVTKLLSDLQWPSLQQRRKEARLVTMYKAVNGLTVPSTKVHQCRQLYKYL